MSPEAAWKATLGELELQMTKATFNTWLRDAKLISYTENEFVIGVRNDYAKDWLDNRLNDTISRTLRAIIGKKVDGLIEIPRVALRNQNQILVVDNDNRIHFRNTEVFRIDGEVVYISGGIENNELICVSQPKTVVDGMQVTPIRETETSDN